MRRGAIAGVLVMALAAVATYLVQRGAGPGPIDGGSYAVARLSSDPGPRWQVPLARLAPGLGCPPDSGNLNPRVDLCSVHAATVVGDTVVLDVQREQRAELIGAASEGGAVRWHRAAPAGSTYDCSAIAERLWCTTGPLQYSVLKPDPGYAGLFDVIERQSAGFTRSSLIEIDPRTGAVLHDARIAGSASGAMIGGIGKTGLYVVTGSTDTERAPLRILRYTTDGTLAWGHDVRFVNGGPTPAPTQDRPPPVRVFEVGGSAYVTATEVAGRQAVFDVATGELTGGGPGHVVTVTADTAVTQQGSAGLTIGGTEVGDQVVAGLAADDRSSGEPVLTTRVGWESTDRPNGDLPPTSPYAIRSVSEPGASRGSIEAEDIPLAFCDGVVLSTGNQTVSGYDSRTGRQVWTSARAGGPDPHARCSGSKLLVVAGAGVTAYDVYTGSRSWAVAIPQGADLIGAELGDPGLGLVLGPTNRTIVGVTTTVTFMR